MKIFIELPTWLGDTVMATPAIENIIKHYPDAKFTLFGSMPSVALFNNHPHIEKCIIDESKKSIFRMHWLYKEAKKLEAFDMAISFRTSFASKIFFFFLRTSNKSFYTRVKNGIKHQVERYNDFCNILLKKVYPAGDLILYTKPDSYTKPTLGINPGASYGSAKRWYPEKFAQVAVTLSHHYDIIIFGGPSEVDIANDIEDSLQKNNILNYQNKAGKTTIEELCQCIGGLDLFITGDSGPMHVAAAYKIPTVAIFGPTKDKETSQWHNPKGIIVKKEMECSPCMKRTCPLKHHECMKDILPKDILDAVKKLNLA